MLQKVKGVNLSANLTEESAVRYVSANEVSTIPKEN
jgi:hypothetical protein